MDDKQTTNADEPWYKEGLRFACTGCGDCCTGGPGYVWVTSDEIEALAAHVGLEVEEFERQFVRKVGRRKTLVELANYDCVFLDEARRCKVYSVRPRQCRTWPFWRSNLRSPEAWKETCRVCPGSGTGRVYSIEEIETQAAVIRL